MYKERQFSKKVGGGVGRLQVYTFYNISKLDFLIFESMVWIVQHWVCKDIRIRKSEFVANSFVFVLGSSVEPQEFY